MTDFSHFVDRTTIPASRWNPAALREHFGTVDLLPLWIADMDFRAPPPVVERLVERARLGMFAYEYRPDSFFEAVLTWLRTRHQWEVERASLLVCPSVMNALCALINLVTDPGDGIIVQPPVFFEFRQAIRRNERDLIKNPLALNAGRYELDLNDLEAKARAPRTRMLVLCNPHNPVGRVWTRAELAGVAEICARHDVFVVTDEIHADIVYPGARYTPFGAVAGEYETATASCHSPAKTFNLTGMMDALVVLPDPDLRKRFQSLAQRFFWNRTNVFSTVAAEVAYREGGPWLDELLVYLGETRDWMKVFIDTHVPAAELFVPEGTYLAWLDFRRLGLDSEALKVLLSHRARVALNPGHWFGREGAGFARMSFACPRQVLEEALTRVASALER